MENELSNIECVDCGDLIPLKRIKVVKTVLCLGCMEEREELGEGTKRHKMDYHIRTKGDELESVETFIVRSEGE